MKIIFFLFLLIFSFSCKSEKIEEIKVIDQVFLQAFGDRYQYKTRQPRMSLYEYSSKEDSLRYLREWLASHNSPDFINDTLPLVLFVSDSLFPFIYNSELIKGKMEISKSDDIFLEILEKNEGEKNSAVHFPLSEINDTYVYKFIKDTISTSEIYDSLRFNSDDFTVIGRVRFSRVLFDKEKQNAIFEMSFHRARLHSWSVLVFCNRNANSWYVVKRVLLSVS